MKVWYIFHSGFLIEVEERYYLFDYYKGELPELQTDKPITVFASHMHADHYNPEIFTLLAARNMQHISAVLAKDIPPRRHPEGIEVLRAYAGKTYALPNGEKLETLLSTDSGVAFLLQVGETVIYHAGDLNDWTWNGESEADNRQMRGNYRHEIDKLLGRRLDIAFVPLDPRLEEHYSAGLSYILKTADVRCAYPMHYWKQPEVIAWFLGDYPEYKAIVKDTESIKGGITL